MKYEYKAINANGNTVTGDIEAASEEDAKSIIADRGHIPVSVTVKKGSKEGGFLDRLNQSLTPVKPPELILFTKQFRTMLRAGVSMVDLLQIMENQTENVRLKRVVSVMCDEIKGGATLYDSFKKHPAVFNDLYCSMIRAGEVSGALPDVLERLTYIIEHEHKIKSDIKAALRYPMIVTIFLGVAFVILLMFVIPQFVGVFKSAGLDLPVPTLICIGMYNFLHNYWMIVLGSLGTGLFVLGKYLKTSNGKFVKDSFLMRLPLFGKLFVKAAMSRFASIFSILQSSGVGVLDAMKILSDSIGNAAITREFDKVSEQLSEGRGISAPLRSAKYFTPMVINMVAIGEETGNLDEMLQEVSVHYDAEVEYSTKGLADAIGPLLTIGLAAVVGFFALAIFLPMWDLTKMVQ